MKRRVFLTLIILGGLVTWMWQDSSLLETSVKPTFRKFISRQVASAPAETQDKNLFEKRLQFEAQKIAQIDSEPQQTEDNLRQWAQSFSMEEIDVLYKKSLDRQFSQDERFLAVMLLGWSQNPVAQKLLENIALDPIDDFLNPGRLGDFERVLRMKAVEGLSDLTLNSSALSSSLQKIISSSTETHVIDRAQRALWAAKGLAPSPSDQDNDAFRKLLERN